MAVARVFWSGRSQAIRLPKEFRFDTREVRIRRHGASLVIEPIAENWDWLDDLSPFDPDFVAATEEEIPEQVRPSLDSFE